MGQMTDAMGGMSISKDSLERASATKEYLTQKMEERKREMAERRARRAELNAKLADPAIPEHDKKRLQEEFDAREREMMREARKRYGPQDFEPLVVIGRGAPSTISI